jgi:hypothetical protein
VNYGFRAKVNFLYTKYSPKGENVSENVREKMGSDQLFLKHAVL